MKKYPIDEKLVAQAQLPCNKGLGAHASDAGPVEVIGCVDLRKSLSDGIVPANVAVRDAEFDVEGDLDPSRIGPKPANAFDAMDLARAASTPQKEPSAAAAAEPSNDGSSSSDGGAA